MSVMQPEETLAPLVTEPMVNRGMAWCLATGIDMTREAMAKLLAHAITPPSRVGRRPTTFNAEAAQRVLGRIAKGESLRSICSEPDMPDDATFLSWVTVQGLGRQYAHARDAGADAKFEELIALADDVTDENANAMRVKADIYKWALSKMKPGKYGDKLAVDVSGTVSFGNMIDAELNQRVARLLRQRLEPLYERLPAPTLDDVIGVFTTTELPGQLVIEHDPNALGGA